MAGNSRPVLGSVRYVKQSTQWVSDVLVPGSYEFLLQKIYSKLYHGWLNNSDNCVQPFTGVPISKSEILIDYLKLGESRKVNGQLPPLSISCGSIV